MTNRVNGINRNPDISNDVCTIYYNTDHRVNGGNGFRVMQTNYMRLEDRGPVYRSKLAAIRAAKAQGFTHYHAQWHAGSFRPHRLPS